MKSFCSLTALMLIASLAFGWGKTGHRIIGQVADHYLSDKSRAEIKKIIGDEALSDACTWMDDVRDDERYAYMDSWHYVQMDVKAEENALSKLGEFIKLLENKNAEASAEDRVMALRGICHLVGDVHQPLHCAYRKDFGGNAVPLKWKHVNRKTNLHKVWDTDLIQFKDMTYQNYATFLIEKMSDDQMTGWKGADPSVWVKESQTHVGQAYAFHHKKINMAYYDDNIGYVEERLSQAGVRLADLLNSIFSKY